MMTTDLLERAEAEYLERLRLDADRTAIEIDRAIVKRFGLAAFVELAWHTVEGEGNYRSNWHINAMCEQLEAVSRGECRRLAIAIPPRHMKTLTVSVMWNAWDWIENPERKFVFSSYAYEVAEEASTKCRRVITSDWYQARWGDRYQLTKDENRKDRFANTKGGARITASVTGQLTGKGGSIFVVDDPHNVQQGESEAVRLRTLRWWREAVSSRLNDPRTGAFVIIQQRVKSNDLLGDVLQRRTALPYTYLCLPAKFEANHPNRWPGDPRKKDGELLWPEHIGAKEMKEFEEMGEYAFAAQYQQRPTPREGGLFKRAWFSKIAKEAPADTLWSRAWDFAATEKKLTKPDPDYTATAKVGFSRSTGKWYVSEVLRWRVDPNMVRNLVLQMARIDGKGSRQTIPKDPGQAGVDQSGSYVAMLSGWAVTAEPQSGDKLSRAMPFAAQAAGGNVILIEGSWHEEFIEEMTLFPMGAHDDQVDCTASAFNRLTGGNTGMLDFMRARAAAMGIGELDVEAERRKQSGMTVETENVADLARAYFGLKGQDEKNKP